MGMGYFRSYERSVIRDYLAATGWKVPSKNNVSKVIIRYGRKNGKTIMTKTLQRLVDLHKPTIMKCRFEKLLHIFHLDKR